LDYGAVFSNQHLVAGQFEGSTPATRHLAVTPVPIAEIRFSNPDTTQIQRFFISGSREIRG
jgi:hypothetical protein